MRHLHRIVGLKFGANILGLLELFALIGILWASGTYSPYRILAGTLAVGGVAGIVAFDLRFRLRQAESSRWTRLFSPFTGGCFLYVPIWFLLPSFMLTVAVLVALKLAHLI